MDEVEGTQAPIFLVGAEDGDVQVAWSPGQAESQMEPPEVNEGYYAVYDRDGRIASLQTSEIDVTIQSWSLPIHRPQLCVVLADYLARNDLLVDAELGSNDYLDKAAREIHKHREQRVFPRVPRRWAALWRRTWRGHGDR